MKIPTLCGNHEVNLLYLVVDGSFIPFLGSCLSPGKGGIWGGTRPVFGYK